MMKVTLNATATKLTQLVNETTSADTTTRVLTLEVSKDLGDLGNSWTVNAPIVPVTYETASGPLQAGITDFTYDDDGVLASVDLDRGYWYDQVGLDQPEAYVAPLTGGRITQQSMSARIVESHLAAILLSQIVGITAADGLGSIFENVLGEFAVTQQDTPDASVQVDTGVAVSADGRAFFYNSDSATVDVDFSGIETPDYLMIAVLYIDGTTGELSLVYGAEHVDTPVAPATPSGGIKIAELTLDEATGVVATANIDMERAGFAGDA